MLRRQRLGGAAPARLKRGPAGQSLQAVAVERAGARKGIGARRRGEGTGGPSRDGRGRASAGRPRGRLPRSRCRWSGRRRCRGPAPRPSATRRERPRSRPCRRPPGLPASRANGPARSDVHPARLGCGGDEAEACGERGREVDGAERADADPGQRAEARLRVAEERQRPGRSSPRGSWWPGVASARTSSGPVPTTQTNFVPPPSTPP